jgi:hypothetical protein
LGRALAEDRFPRRQVLVVTQRDGKTGCLHNHIVVNSVETRTGKSLNSSIVMHSRLVEAHERILEAEGFQQRADLKQAFSDASERHERGEPSGLRRSRLTEQSELREFMRYVQWETESAICDELGLPHETEPFSVSALKGCIQQALDDPAAVDWTSFVDAGARYGVRIEQRGKKGRGISYGMMRAQSDGTQSEPSASDRRRCSTLGVEYEMDAVEEAFARNLAAHQTALKQPAPSGVRLPASRSNVESKPIEERLRDAMAEIDEQFRQQRATYEQLVAARRAQPEVAEPLRTRHEETAAATTPLEEIDPSYSEIVAASGDSEKSDNVVPGRSRETQSWPEPVAPATEDPSTVSPAEELRAINQRNRRLGLPLLSHEEFAAHRAMSPAQRKLRLKRPELFDDPADGSADGRRGHEFGK